jgi:hypothetical protein
MHLISPFKGSVGSALFHLLLFGSASPTFGQLDSAAVLGTILRPNSADRSSSSFGAIASTFPARPVQFAMNLEY